MLASSRAQVSHPADSTSQSRWRAGQGAGVKPRGGRAGGPPAGGLGGWGWGAGLPGRRHRGSPGWGRAEGLGFSLTKVQWGGPVSDKLLTLSGTAGSRRRHSRGLKAWPLLTAGL